MRIVSVVGTRPQLIKAAALWPSLRARHDEVFVDTGQHWDEPMAGAFFGELGPAAAAITPSGSAAGRAPSSWDGCCRPSPRCCERERPDAVLVYGDTNSTLAGRARRRSRSACPVAHVEAGLRSFDRRMPEETNRVLTDHVSRWLFAPTPAAVANLAAEGVTAGVDLVGDVMQDLAARIAPSVRDAGGARADRRARSASRSRPGALPVRDGPPGREPVAGGGRRVGGAARAPPRGPDRPVVLALHPGNAGGGRGGRRRAAGRRSSSSSRSRTRRSLALQLHAAAVLTDSGGVQREAAWLGVPCLVLRETTEWVEAVAESGGSMVVVGVDRERALAELDRLAPADDRADPARATGAASLDLAPAGAASASPTALESGG